MFAQTLFLLTAIGLAVGSFLNVVAYRLPRGESPLWPGSRCPRCGHPLEAWDLVPVLSFILLKGRCRYCRGPIPRLYLLVEILTGAYFLLAGLTWGVDHILVRHLVLGSILIAVARADLETLTIPDWLTLGGSAMALALPPGPHLTYFIGGVTGFLLLFVIAQASRGGMGGGDVKLALTLGLFLGWPLILVALFFAFSLGATAGIALVLAKIKKRTDILPFGPFLALGGIIASLWGNKLLQFYLASLWR